MDREKSERRSFWRILLYPLIHGVDLWRTLIFNLYYFPLKIACRLPVFIYRGTRLRKLSGRVELQDGTIRPGMVRIGCKLYGFHHRFHRTIWEQKGGTVVFGPYTLFGRGSFLTIGKNAILKVGREVIFGGNCKIIVRSSIVIGERTIAAWDVNIIDTDFHHTYNTIFKKENILIQPIVVGKKNWLCMGVTLLKGAQTPDYCIVSTNTTISRDFSDAGTNVILGHDAEVKVKAKYIGFNRKTNGEDVIATSFKKDMPDIGFPEEWNQTSQG